MTLPREVSRSTIMHKVLVSVCHCLWESRLQVARKIQHASANISGAAARGTFVWISSAWARGSSALGWQLILRQEGLAPSKNEYVRFSAMILSQ